MNPDTLTLRLALTVSYGLNGTPPEVLREMLLRVPDRAASDGLLTGETSAEVDEWNANVEQVSGPAAASEEAPTPIAAHLAGALESALLQIEQTKGLFSDSDGTIAAAIEDGREALEAWRACPHAAPVPATPTEVWTLTITHRHGVNITVHRTEQGAKDELFNYVSQWWAHEIGAEPMPEDYDAACTRYFEVMSDESAAIEPTELND